METEDPGVVKEPSCCRKMEGGWEGTPAGVLPLGPEFSPFPVRESLSRKHKARESLANDSLAAEDNHIRKYTWADFAHRTYGNIIQEHYEHTEINL